MREENSIAQHRADEARSTARMQDSFWLNFLNTNAIREREYEQTRRMEPRGSGFADSVWVNQQANKQAYELNLQNQTAANQAAERQRIADQSRQNWLAETTFQDLAFGNKAAEDRAREAARQDQLAGEHAHQSMLDNLAFGNKAAEDRAAALLLSRSTTRSKFRQQLTNVLQEDAGHPLRFLLDETGRLRTSTRAGVTAFDWLEHPEIIEAGHLRSRKSLSAPGEDIFTVMSAHKNRRLAATIEHGKFEGSYVDYSGDVLNIAGVPVDAETARDWVHAGLISENLLRSAQKIIFH